MSREIKLRVYDKTKGYYVAIRDIDCFDIRQTARVIVELTSLGHEFIIEQFTGLKDKNGKEIYEGDILGGIWENGYIAWCDKCKQFQYHISTNECMACLGDVHWHELVEDDGKLEIIGTIHENPELLGGEE